MLLDSEKLIEFLTQLANEADEIDPTPVSHKDALEFFVFSVKQNLEYLKGENK